MPGLELYLIVLCLGLVGLGLLAAWRFARREEVGEPGPEHAQTRKQDVRATRAGHGASASRPPSNEPVIQAEDLPNHPPIAQLLFARRPSQPDRECPNCKRKFDETMVLCPFDSTPLRSTRQSATRFSKPSVVGTRRPSCVTCGRRYEGSARFCYADGSALLPSGSEDAPVFRLCKNCGHETSNAHEACGCDNPTPVEVDPAEDRVELPTLPMMRCRRCHRLAVPGQTHCPADGELLLPVMNLRMNALAPTGVGPRRKICEKCGRQFSKAAAYCAYDGSRLKLLN